MIHIVGANGYIGTKLCAYLDNKGISFLCYSDVVDEKCTKLDLINFDEKSITLKENDIVVLLAAISSPDICQNNYELAYKVNVIGTSNLIDYCIKHKANVIFLSSDTVNGDTKDQEFDEYSKVNPFGNYAKMKYEIEERYMNNEHFKAIRLSYVLSNEDKFTSYLSQCVAKNEVAEVFDGFFRNVILLDTVLEAIYCLCCNFYFNDYYLVNASGLQNLSRKDLAEWYKIHINKKLMYNVIAVPDSLLKGRPNIIKTKSLFLEKLLGHKLEKLL